MARWIRHNRRHSEGNPMRWGFSLVLLGVLATSSGQARADLNLNTNDAYLFDLFSYDGTGGPGNGTIDAYDVCYTLTVNGTYINFPIDADGVGYDDAWTTYYGGAGFQTDEFSVGGLRVTRYGYVPQGAGDPSYIRYIDTVRNTGAAATNVTFSYYCNLGSDGYGAAGENDDLQSTEDGDDSLESTDAWAITDDSDLGGDPSLGHVFFQPGAEVTTDTMTYVAGSITWTYTFSVGAGDTSAIMIFGVQQASRAAALTDVTSAVNLDDPALAEVGIELDGVRNFVLGGAPLVNSGGPYDVDEGSCVDMHATVTDREGDPVTFAWDLDGDGNYETEELDAQFCATDLDGPMDTSVGVVASDDQGNAVTRQVPIHVLNVAPTITSAPVLTAVAGGHYEYQLVVDDPAGAADPPIFRFTNEGDDTFPLGMTLDAAGLLAWDPRPDQANNDFDVQLEVDDGDDGVTPQEFSIHVRPNTVPTAPEPAYPTLADEPVDVTRPTLIARNASDPDGDTLTYDFRISDDVGFANSVDSGPVEEGGEGATQWTVTYDLEPGTSYYWKVTATDGIGTSDEGFSSFTVSPDAQGGGDGDADADADSDGDDDGGGRSRGPGCACRTTGDAPSTPALLLVGLLAALLAYRRR
jgi:MYXO-CTERM domain-containing protein